MGKASSIIIHPKCVIGNNVSILHGVIIGGNIYKERNGQVSPFIENNVFIGSGAKILGPVKYRRKFNDRCQCSSDQRYS